MKQKNYELVISPIVEHEINDTELVKKETILSFMETIKLTKIPFNNDAYNLAWNYIADGILTYNHLDDLLHVAYATINECDVIISWNRKHLAKNSKVQKINLFNITNSYSSISIFTPQEFLTRFK
jgi:predicted nucleic acid-binding protein